MPIDTSTVERIARELSLRPDEATVDRCLELLAAQPSIERPPPRPSVGRRSTDQYNALLDVYETPRAEATTGPLAGLTFAIKDNTMVRDLRLTCGFRGLEFVPATDAVVVERLLAAGGSVVGKSNMDALAVGPGGVWSEHGQVRNPVYEDLVPGGSSSGSAAAVAAGLVDAALGTDTGGSVRKPAAYCGLVGVKPTPELVPRHGVVPLAPSMDAVGPLTRDVATAARVLDVLVGADPRDPSSSRAPVGSMVDGLDAAPALTVGLPNAFFDCATDGVAAAVRSVIDRLEDRHPVAVETVSLDHAGLVDTYANLSGGEFAWLVKQSGLFHGLGAWYDEAWFDAFRDLLARGINDHVTTEKFPAAAVDVFTDGRSYIRARRACADFERRLSATFSTVDVLVCPAIPTSPPPLDAGMDDAGHDRSANLRPFSVARTPAVVVPAGEVDGRPVSVQVAAPAFEDARALAVAKMVETVVT